MVQSWTLRTFKPRKEPSYRTVIEILKNEVVVTDFMNSEGYLRKKVRRNRSNAPETRHPRCFEVVSGAELGLDYESDAKAWMNSTIHFDLQQ